MTTDRYVHEPMVFVQRQTMISGVTGTIIKIPFDTSVFNPFGCWNFVNHEFTCPKAGRYLIQTTVPLIVDTLAVATVGITVSSPFYKELVTPTSVKNTGDGHPWYCLTTTNVYYLNVGDKFSVAFNYFYGTASLSLCNGRPAELILSYMS